MQSLLNIHFIELVGENNLTEVELTLKLINIGKLFFFISFFM